MSLYKQARYNKLQMPYYHYTKIYHLLFNNELFSNFYIYMNMLSLNIN
jgi:hypothetical protein